MKIILVGAGGIGKQIISSLSSENHEITVIDKNQDKIELVINNFDVAGIVGNGSDQEILKEAEVKDADIFISTTDEDEGNIINCLIAKALGAKFTIARIRSPHFYQENKLLEYLGISLQINPEKEVADAILKVIETPEATEINSFDGETYLLSSVIKEKSKLVDKTLAEITNEFSSTVLFGIIVRDNEIFIPSGNSKVKAGDLVYFIGTRESIKEFFDKLKINNTKIKNIMIVEGGKITSYLLDELKNKYNVKVIIHNREQCKNLSQKYNKITFVNSDGTDQNTLKSQGIEEVDCFVSLAEIDEENLIAALFANNLKVNKIVMKVQRANLSKLINYNNFATVVSPQELVAERIITYVRSLDNPYGSKVEKLYKLLDGQVEAIEFIIGSDCKFINKKLKQVKLIKNTLIASIIRDGNTIIPNGETEIVLNDKVIVISKNNIMDINDILR